MTNSGRITLHFDRSASESDVEQKFLFPFLVDKLSLAIPQQSVFTKTSIKRSQIDKGANRRWYTPDYLIYCDSLPVMILEAKKPGESISEAFKEAQLYALEINSSYPSAINPAAFVVCSNGEQIAIGNWDSAEATVYNINSLVPSSVSLEAIRADIHWDRLIDHSESVRKALQPAKLVSPHEHLGENRVRLAKAGYNSLFEEIDPVLRRYFDARNEEAEAEIIERGYVSTEETTKYEKTFETFLRDRSAIDTNPNLLDVTTSKRSERGFGTMLEKKMMGGQPYMQLLIGNVGAGKTTFIKRFFRHLVDIKLREKLVVCRFDFNKAPDDGSAFESWVMDEFVEIIRSDFSQTVPLQTSEGLRSVFSKEIRDKKGAYDFIRASSEADYNTRLGSDMLSWIDDKKLFSSAIARFLASKGKSLIVIFDNVDRKDRDVQLRVFQTAQWFMNLTGSLCITTLRDETYENYKSEKPLDAFSKNTNFYIKAPRFIDMVKRRLDLAISHLLKSSNEKIEYDIPGIGRVTYPKTKLGEYLNSIYVDVFRKQRTITEILEGLAGKDSRKALEMFSAVLTSAHFDTRDFTSAGASQGETKIQEATILKSLMRTNYLYFFEGHGFVHNIFNFHPESKDRSHFLKIFILDFLIENRKKIGDVRFEGFFSVGFLIKKFANVGFIELDVHLEIESLLEMGLITSERFVTGSIELGDSVRIHVSGFVHCRRLTGRIDYISSVALVTPIADDAVARLIAERWHISDHQTDINRMTKNIIAKYFMDYLETKLLEIQTRSALDTMEFNSGYAVLSRINEAIGFKREAQVGQKRRSKPSIKT